MAKKPEKETLEGAIGLASELVGLENEVFLLFSDDSDAEPNLHNALDRVDEITCEDGELDALRKRLEAAKEEDEKAGIREEIENLEKELAENKEEARLAIAEAIHKIEDPRDGVLAKLAELQACVAKLFRE